MFNGPPPPIALSTVLRGGLSRLYSKNSSSQERLGGILTSGRASIRRALFAQRQLMGSQAADSAWRALQLREQALEFGIQQLLDHQAAGLGAGSAGLLGSASGNSYVVYNDNGDNTPTGIVSSPEVYRARMPRNSPLPPQPNPDGNVISVRQPAEICPVSLRGARDGLQKSIKALRDLKKEEVSHVQNALLERQVALTRLNKLESRRMDVCNELQALQGNDEEPLGKELRQLGVEYISLGQEIRNMEETLVGMRTRRRWLKEKMDDAKSKRDAGVSGYEGALREVDARISALMRRPPVQPLDQGSFYRDWPFGSESGLAVGHEFMQLDPESRKLEMAKSWWEVEISMLQQRKIQIHREQVALKEGGDVWHEAMSLVSSFESALRDILRAGKPSPLLFVNGSVRVSLQDDLIRCLLPKMGDIISGLKQRMRLAEKNRWNLIICAIGAELTAFEEAHNILRKLVHDSFTKHSENIESTQDP